MLLALIIYGMTLFTVFAGGDTDPDPCDTVNYIHEWQRSVAYTGDATLCDNFLEAAWYRITSGAGERMPTGCPAGGFRCNTLRPIYLNADAVPPGENLFPDVGQIVEREALSSDLFGSCAHSTFNIKIKGCNGYLVYHLVPTGGCTTAYCFGDQLPCPAGEYSPTGFSPGCKASPNISVTPYVTSQLKVTEKMNEHNSLIVYNLPVFECHADDLVVDFIYQIKWYINDIEIEEALTTNLTKAQVDNGGGRMLEEHWKAQFKPNMLVNCSIQVGGNDHTIYGPKQSSGSFFAGLKIKQSPETDFTVLEGKEIQISIYLTLPLACSWPKTLERFPSFVRKIKESECVLVILNGLPKYQTDNKQCVKGINDKNVVFGSENCGVVFSHVNWEEERLINITGPPDGMITSADRIVFLRLYNADSVNPIADLSYWKNVHLPDIKLIIVDSEVATLGKECHSNNDPHMKTFDGKHWELQTRRHGLQPGEYIMYKHNRLPLQVSAYFRQCGRGILCNCGVAVRSGDSVFVANYCGTTYYGRNRVNRYRIQRLCDDQSLIIEKTSKQYTITLPTGTQVLFNYGVNWIDGIRIYPSILDFDLTSGLCGRYNEDSSDDFTPRGQLVATTSNQIFAESWQVKGAHKDDTLFDPEGRLKETEYYGQQYCTCVTNVDTYPHDSPEYNCDLTSAMELCRKTKSTAGVFTASCVTRARKKRSGIYRYERQIDEVDENQPPTYPMVEDSDIPSMTASEWINGWTEITAREHCESKFNSAAAYDICTEYLPFIDTEPFIDSCILDIKYTGSEEWTKITLRNYASSCLHESKRLANLTSTNSTNSTGFSKPIADIIAELTCFDNCSNNGVCTEGICQCHYGYYGDLCSDSKSKAPAAIVDAFEDTCDTNKKSCNSILFPANGIVDSPDLKCKLKTVKIKNKGTYTTTEEGSTSVHQGTYFNDLYAKCPLHGSRRKRSADSNVVATAYFVSISNDGHNYSDTVTTVVFDSVCYACNSTTLSCVIKDTCTLNETLDNADTEDGSSSYTGVAIGAAVGGFVVVIIIVALSIKMIQIGKQKDQFIRDSFVSLPATGRSCPPRFHFVTDNDIFLSERFKTKSTLSVADI